MRLPYLKWYFRDAQADLRLLPTSPRCVWYEMLWIMASCERYGFLERQGRPMTDAEIATLSGLSVLEVAEARVILLADNIPGIEEGTSIWYSRRMVADEHKRQLCIEAGHKGGGSPLLTPPAATESEPRTQNPSKAKGAPYRSPLKVQGRGTPKQRGRFVPPTLEEVQAYVSGHGYHVDPEEFMASNVSKGWVVGKNRTLMDDWQATVRTWDIRYRKDHPEAIKTVWTPEQEAARIAALQKHADSFEAACRKGEDAASNV